MKDFNKTKMRKTFAEGLGFCFAAVSVLFGISSTGLAQSTPPIEMLQPVRQTTGRVRIEKYEIKKHPGGGYQWTYVPVCQKDIVINVYDGRGKSSFGFTHVDSVECESQVAGAKTTLSVRASVVLRDQAIFDGEPVSDVRSNHFQLDSLPTGIGGPRVFLATGQVLSRDVNASALLTAEQGLNWDCSSGQCQPVGEESFVATVEFGP